MKKTIIVTLALYAFIAIGSISYYLSVIPDDVLLKQAITKEQSNFKRLDKVKSWLSKTKLEVFGFKNKCNLTTQQSKKTTPIIHFLIGEYSDSVESINPIQVKKTISAVIKRGCDINTTEKYAKNNFSALHIAIAFGEKELVSFILKEGGNIEKTITSTTKVNGLDAIQFTEFLIKSEEENITKRYKDDILYSILTILKDSKLKKT